MVSKNRIKSIRALALKKNRDVDNIFVAEGPKIVGEFLSIFSCLYLAAKPQWLACAKSILHFADTVDEITEEELHQISFLKSPQEVLAVFRKPTVADISISTLTNNLSLALDGVQDPGNVGTILRLADWFGIDCILCSPDTADIFSPKVIQASMGATARVKAIYTDLPTFFQQLPVDFPIYGTFLSGNNIYLSPLEQKGIIVMGNEGKGIRPETEHCVTQRLFIPSFPTGRSTSESLNVAIATAIICGEFRRRTF